MNVQYLVYEDGVIAVALVAPSAGSVLLRLQGSILYVRLGALPCQLDARPIATRECPPFSQNYDDAGLTMADRGSRKVLFRGRYVGLTPLQLAGTTFVLVETYDERTRNELAVIKPRLAKTFEPVCLLRRGRHPRANQGR
jgi:hypothetical protein